MKILKQDAKIIFKTPPKILIEQYLIVYFKEIFLL